MKIKVGHYYKAYFSHYDIIKVLDIDSEEQKVYIELVADPNNVWKDWGSDSKYEYFSTFNKIFKELKGYNSPLWRAINGEKDVR